jgi:hypothetical protein
MRALASIKARREKLLGTPDTSAPQDFSATEPMPILDAPDEYAKGFFDRLKNKEEPPRGIKPRLVVSNEPKSDSDDDPEPPKA